MENEKKAYLKINSATMEKMVVAYLYKDQTTFLRLAKYLVTKSWSKDSHFQDNSLQLILNLFSLLNDRYKKLPSLQEIDSSLESILSKDEILLNKSKNVVREILDQKFDVDGQPSSEYVKDFLVDFIKRDRAVEATILNQQDIENNNYENLSKRMQDAVNINLDKNLGVGLDDYAVALSMIKEVDNKDSNAGCCWGSKRLNIDLGKIQAGELGLVAGVPGGGKTIIMQHIALSNYTEGKNVVVFSFEVSEQRLLSRYYKSLLKANTQELLTFTPEQVQERLSGITGKLRIVNRPANTCSSNDMSAILRDLQVYENFTPDLIVVDYILITAANAKVSLDNTYKYYKTVSEELRNLAIEWKCPVVSGVQLNRNALGEQGGSKDNVSSKDIAESKAVIDTADYFLVIQQNSVEKLDKELAKKGIKKGVYRLRIDKNRNGSSGRTTRLDIDWDTLAIQESSKQDD